MQAGWKVGPGKTGGGVLQDRVCSAEAEGVRGRGFGAGQQDADCAGDGGMGKESKWAGERDALAKRKGGLEPLSIP